MKMLSFSVFDSAVKAYLPPFFARSRGEALRSFVEACAGKDHQFAKHPRDYALFALGEFDDNTGLFASNSRAPELVITAIVAVESSAGGLPGV